MKILIVIPAYIPDFNKGGSVTGCHSFAKICNESTMEVTVSTLDTCRTKKYYTEIKKYRTKKLVKNSSKIYEVAVNYNGRSYSEGKKIRYIHAIDVIYWILITKLKVIFSNSWNAKYVTQQNLLKF